MPNIDTRVAAIFRKDRPIMPEGTTVIEADDEVFFVAAKEHIRSCIGELRKTRQAVQKTHYCWRREHRLTFGRIH